MSSMNNLVLNGDASQSLALLKESAINLEPQALEKIANRLPEIYRATKTAGRRNTQTTSQLMTLNMAGDEPYRHLRQILAQIEKKKNALEAGAFKMKKNEIHKKNMLAKGDELSLLRVQEMDAGLERSRIYVEGAVKEIGMYQDAYDEIREAHGIPDNWDERDSEEAEIRHHIKMGFRTAFQEMMSRGMIGRGSAEYLEQFGIHPQVARKHLYEYISGIEKLMEEGKEPDIEHFHNFLDAMADKFNDAHKLAMKRIGLKSIVREDFCFKDVLKG